MARKETKMKVYVGATYMNPPFDNFYTQPNNMNLIQIEFCFRNENK